MKRLNLSADYRKDQKGNMRDEEDLREKWNRLSAIYVKREKKIRKN